MNASFSKFTFVHLVKILFFSEVKWQYMRTRKQQLLQRFPADWQILFLEPYTVGRPNSFRPRWDGNVCFVTLPYFKNFPQRWLRRLLGLRLMRACVVGPAMIWVWVLMRRCGFRQPDLLLVSNIYAAPLIRWFGKGKPVIYDCNDHHLSFAYTPVWAERYFSSLCNRVDRIVCVSASLGETMPSAHRDKIVVIGNGVDYVFFSANNAEKPARMRFGPAKPILLFVGAIFEWIDFDLLMHVAAEHSDKMLVLIGPASGLVQPELQKLLAAPNVRYLGEVPYQEMPAYLAAADVCLMPFVKTQHTQVTNPGKLYQYLAAGKPIVSTAVSPELVAMHEVIFLAEDAATFAAQIEPALVTAEARAEERRRLAAANDWQEKAKQMVGLIEEVCHPK